MNRSLPPLTLDQLTALNDEIIALCGASVPLQLGLRELGKDLPGKLGEAAKTLASRLEAGESLEHIFATSDGIPTAYAAIIEAGVRSGQLSTALKSMATLMRRVAELRRIFTASLVYPLIVMAMAYALTLYTLSNFNIASLEIFKSFDTTPTLPIHWVENLKSTMAYWVAIPPLLVICVLAIMLLRCRSAPAAPAVRGYWLPSIRRMVRDGRIYAFLEVLTLLVEHDTPLDEAIQLAGNASGDASLAKASGEMAKQVRGGRPLETNEFVPSGFPPLLGWLLMSGRQQPQLVLALRRMSANYAMRAERTATYLSFYLPVLLSSVLGGGATLAYGLIALGPWYHLLFRLGIDP